MRKYIREIMRTEGKHQRLKPSRYVKAAFERLQQKRYGVEKRKENQAKGTHKRYLWAARTSGLNGVSGPYEQEA